MENEILLRNVENETENSQTETSNNCLNEIERTHHKFIRTHTETHFTLLAH